MKAQLRKLLPAMLGLFALDAAAVTHYVDLNSPGPTPPFTNWLTAATNIQDAVDAAVDGNQILVTNGVYNAGGRFDGFLTNRVRVNKAVTVQSINGPAVTAIEGYQVPGATNGSGAVRCVYLADGATLTGFTLTNGATQTGSGNSSSAQGGGIKCQSVSAVVSNCVLVGNSAVVGGGAYRGTLNNCLLTRNSASYGGGAYGASLRNCTCVGNFAAYAGGGIAMTDPCVTITRIPIFNSVVFGNAASSNANYFSWCYYFDFNYCCTMPLNGTGLGNITNAPLFLDEVGGDFRLQSNSPCINAGKNSYAPSGPDLDGNARVAGGTVDIGSHEFQSPSSVLSYAWAQQNGLPTDSSADFTDPDGDGANNWHEWRADTIPTNALSVLRMVIATNDTFGLGVTWQSVSTRNYWLERATNLSGVPPFQSIATNIAGASGSKKYTDTSATNGGPFFYRVGVQ